MGRRIANESKQTVRGGPKPAKVGLHRRLGFMRPTKSHSLVTHFVAVLSLVLL
jgi:hypothetical protein